MDAHLESQVAEAVKAKLRPKMAPGAKGAINLGPLVDQADRFVREFLPALEKYLPATVDAYAEIAAAALHAANGILNPTSPAS